jgi:putative hydrolase of the HAD superfamily
MIKAVFFDAGETLVHPHPSFQELFASICREHGFAVYSWDVEEVQSRLAPHLVDIAHEAESEKQGSRPYTGSSLSPSVSRTFWTSLYRRFLRELGIGDEGLASKLFQVFSDISSYSLFDDVLPTLEELRSTGYRLGVISNFERWLEEMLVELRVGDLFHVRVISGIEGVEKPDPAIYRLALDRVGLDGSEAMHVGDSLSMDVEPAQAAGMRAVLLDRIGRYAGVRCPTIRSLKELPALLSKIR